MSLSNEPRNISIAQAIAAIVVMMAYAWLNTFAMGDGFGGSRGFPFRYDSFSDAVFSEQLNLLALAGNAIVWLGLLIAIWRYWPRSMRTKPSWGQAAVLLSFSGAYVWMNSQVRFDLKQMFLPAWAKTDAARLFYGFPFSYTGESGMKPWLLVVDLVIGLALLMVVERVYDRRARKQAG